MPSATSSSAGCARRGVPRNWTPWPSRSKTTVAKLMPTGIAADQISYEDLYARWEQGDWSAMKIDFSVDRSDWHERLTDLERRSAMWTYSMFLHGEDSVTDNLSPYIDAAPLEEQKYFLATQQVDEARHAVMFARFMREAVGTEWGYGGTLEATKPELTW